MVAAVVAAVVTAVAAVAAVVWEEEPCPDGSRACALPMPSMPLDVLSGSPSHRMRNMACNNTHNACQKPKAGKA